MISRDDSDRAYVLGQFKHRVEARNGVWRCPACHEDHPAMLPDDDGVRGGQGRDDNALRDGYVIVVGVLVTLMLVWSVVWVLAGDK